MPDVLDEQIGVFEALLPEIRKKYGHVWALIAGGHLVETFSGFSEAATYARDHFGPQPVLIRHTDSRKMETDLSCICGPRPDRRSEPEL